MRFAISDEDLKLIRSYSKELLIGIVMRGGELRLRIADERVYRGHVAWLRQDSIPRDTVELGFAIIVKSGCVHALFPMSELNSTADYSLRDDEIQQLKDLLPLADNFKVFGCL